MAATSKPRAWLTLDEIPSGKDNRAISLPDGEDWRAQFLGALFLLTESRNYEQFGDLTPEENATEWRSVMFEFLDGDPVIIPVGIIQHFAGTVVPTGWLRCNGQEVSRSVYSDLFAIIGTIYGVGDGSTTFNVPDGTGRVCVMRDAMDPDINSLGETTGSKDVTLTIAQIPSHTHIQNSHVHSMPMNLISPNPGTPSGGGNFAMGAAGQNTGSTTPTNQSTGGGGSHSNMQPSIVFDLIIKY